MILRVVEFCILQNEKTPERIKHECLDCVPLDPQSKLFNRITHFNTETFLLNPNQTVAGNQPLRGPGYEYIELVKS